MWDSLRARGQGWPGRPQGDTYSLRRLGSPWKTLALRQPMRLLERSLQGKRRGLRAGDTLLSPGWSWGLPKGLQRHLQMLQLGEAEEGAWLDCADQVVLQVPAGRQTQSSGRAAGSPVRRRPAQWGQGHEPPSPAHGFLSSPGPAKPPAGSSLAAFHPISLSLSLRRAQGRYEAPRCSRGGCQPLCSLRAHTAVHRPPARLAAATVPACALFPDQLYPAGYLLSVG